MLLKPAPIFCEVLCLFSMKLLMVPEMESLLFLSTIFFLAMRLVFIDLNLFLSLSCDLSFQLSSRIIASFLRFSFSKSWEASCLSLIDITLLDFILHRSCSSLCNFLISVSDSLCRSPAVPAFSLIYSIDFIFSTFYRNLRPELLLGSSLLAS